MISNKYLISVACLLTLLFLSIGISVCMGAYPISFIDAYKVLGFKILHIPLNEDISQTLVSVIWHVRLPRILLAILVGAGLSCIGCVMQASVQNILADPYILGISSGATLGATIAVVTGVSVLISGLGLPAFAFIGSLLATIIILLFTKKSHIYGNSVKLILVGQAVSLLFGGLANLTIYLGNDAEKIRTVTYWLMGSLAGAKWDNIWIVIFAVAVSLFFFLLQFRVLNVMSLGNESAITLGIDLSKYRQYYMIICAFTTAILVSSCGIVGFIGFIIPHMVRSITGNNHIRLLPAASLTGAIFVIWADIFARTFIKNSEIPLGIITAIVGAPIFIWMLLKNKYNLR